MKKITLLFVLIISFGLTTVSCSKKDSEPSIEGKWISSQLGTIVNGQEVLTAYPHTLTCEKDYTIFSGSVSKDVYYEKTNGVCVENTDSGTFTRNGAELKVVLPSATRNCTILNLTDTELKFSYIENDKTNVAVFTKG